MIVSINKWHRIDFIPANIIISDGVRIEERFHVEG